ncbi:hypothetical protein ACQP3J_33780, partial [Escherichia coli]
MQWFTVSWGRKASPLVLTLCLEYSRKHARFYQVCQQQAGSGTLKHTISFFSLFNLIAFRETASLVDFLL